MAEKQPSLLHMMQDLTTMQNQLVAVTEVPDVAPRIHTGPS